MRLIDADKLHERLQALVLDEWNKTTFTSWSKAFAEVADMVEYDAPTIEPDIIRCKDCKYYQIAWLKKDGTDDKRYRPSICVKGQYGITRKPDWYCADAEMRGEKDE